MNAQRSLRQRVEVEEVYPQGVHRIRKGDRQRLRSTCKDYHS